MNHEENYEEFKYKSVAHAYAISGLVPGHQIGKPVLAETKRKWERGKLLGVKFLEFLNETLPRPGKCDLNHIKFDYCQFDIEKDELLIQFDVPMLNKNFELAVADPFISLERKGNLTCTMRYSGPSNIIISNGTGCIQPLLNNLPILNDLLIYPLEECRQNAEKEKYAGIRCGALCSYNSAGSS